MLLFSGKPRPARLLVPTFALGLTSLAHAQAPVSSSVASTNKAELVNRVDEYVGNDIWPSKVVAAFNLKLSSAAWKVMLSESGVKGVAGVARDFGEYVKDQNIGDLEATETADGSDRKGNQGEVDELLAKIKGKIGLTVEATQPKLSPAQGQLLLRYLTYLGEFAGDEDWTPRGGRANFKLIFSSTAKDIAVTASKDATNFTIVAPAKEPDGWDSKIEAALKRSGK